MRGVAKPGEPGGALAHTLEGCGVAAFHVNAHDFCLITAFQGVPKTTMTMFDTRVLDVIEDSGWGGFPAVLVSCDYAGGMVLTEDPVCKLVCKHVIT